MPNDCPSREELLSLVRGDLSDAGPKSLERHLETCADCQQFLEHLSAGYLNRTPRLAPPAPSLLLEQVLRQLREYEATAGVAADPSLEPGVAPQSFGDYEILGELGRGGMGVVYRARQVSLNRTVALKLILAGQLASPAEVRRFQNEAEAAARLDNPGIVPIYEVGEHDGRHFLSMKLVEGEPLSARLGKLRAQQSPRQMATLVSRVAQAVHYAHQRSILHRDLKPANILLDSEDQPHLTDFGLAKLLESDAALTHSQAVMGTPDYLSPEVAAGRARDVTTAADIFSLGAILYELLTGSPPFHADTAAATIQRVLNEEPRPLRAVAPGVPRDLETIALKCLEKDPARRYASAAEVAEELDRFARGETILARPVTPPERVWRWARRKPALATLVVALHLVFAAGLAGILWQWQRADRHAAEESAQRQRAETFARNEVAQHRRAEYQRSELLLAQGKLALPLALLARELRGDPTNTLLAARIRSVLDSRGVCVPVGQPLQHPGPIRLARYSTDGVTIITVGDEPAARLWDAKTLKPHVMLRHGEAVRITGLIAIPGSPLIATVTDRGAVRLWNSQDGEAVGRLVHGREVPLIATSPDGRILVSVSEHMLRVCELPSGRQLASATPRPGGPPRSVQFSMDGRFIVTAGPAATELWEANSLQRLAELPGAREAKFAPDGDHVLLNRSEFWNWRETRRLGAQFETGEEPIFGAEFSPDSRSLLLAAGDWGARLLNIETLTLRVPVLTHEQPVKHVAFSRDGSMMLTISASGLVSVWDVRSGEQLAEPIHHQDEVMSAEFSPDNRRLLILLSRGEAQVRELRLHGARSRRFFHGDLVTSVQFVAEGKQVFTTSRDGTAQVWERDTGRAVFPSLKHAGGVIRAAVSHDGQWLATVGADHAARIWNARTGEAKHPPLKHVGVPHLVEFDATGARLLTGANDGVARVWNTTNGTLLLEVKQLDLITAAHFSPDAKQILTASRDGLAQLWDAQTGKPVFKPFEHGNAVVAAAFTPDGIQFATGSRDRLLQIWDRQTGREAGPPLEHPAGLRPGALHFNQNGGQVVTAAGNSAYVWHVENGRPVCPPLDHTDLVLDAQFSPDGRIIATASRDDTARFWDLATGLPLSEPLPHGARVECLAFSPDGRWLATAAADGSVHLWEVPVLTAPAPEWLADLAEGLGRQKVNYADHVEPVRPNDFVALRDKIVNSTATDEFTAWAKWLLNVNASRPISPHARITSAEYAELLAGSGRVENLREAARLAPTNQQVHALLARALLAEAPTKPDLLREADWQSRLAELLAPENAEAKELREAVHAVLTNSPVAVLSIPGSKATKARPTTTSKLPVQP